jgi:ketosteroid isomerase-like protein
MGTGPASVATTYFEAWHSHDFDRLRSILHDDVTFRGPLGTADDAETAMKGLRGMAGIITKLVVQKMFVDGDDVVTWFDLSVKDSDPMPTVNWSHVENGKITRIRVVFDPRPMLDG